MWSPPTPLLDQAEAGRRRRDDAARNVDQLIAHRHGLSPSLVFRWGRLMSEGVREAVRADNAVSAASDVRRLEERVSEPERSLGRKTLEVEILKERAKKPTLLSHSPLLGDTR